MKSPFDALADLLATPEGLRTARLLQAAGLLGAPTPTAPQPLPRPPEPISIWEPREVDRETVWIRPDPQPLGDHFAATKVLRRKQAELPLRVGFFGESVAAGYLYAPHVTPARVLEGQLREIGGSGDFEVVDLARTNETLASLAETVRTAVQIQPDVLVLFAGNNWNLLETPEVSPYAPSVLARRCYGQALREEGIAGPVRHAAERLRVVAESALGAIAEIAGWIHVPVVVVIPEVNLADWETRQPPVCLAGESTARWHALYAEAVERLGREDFPAALAAARAMRELDGGACASTWRLLARAQIGLGEIEAAERSCRAEIDAAPYATLAFLSAPQATTAAREILLDAARRHGFMTVDLRRIFAEHAGPALPGRRLFLDYCHLTLEGIQVAMAAVAAEVLSLSGMIDEPPAWSALLRLPAPAISPEAEATARFGAAVHTAHRLLSTGSRGPLLEHWCEAALDASPGIEGAMLDLVAARCAPGPAVLTAAQQRNLASPYRLTLQHGWRWDHLDADLIAAIRTVLERRGSPAGELIDRLLLEHLAVREEGTELLAPIHLWEPLERFFPEVMDLEDLPRRATLRSPWPETSLCLICDAARDVEVDVTLRLPFGGGPVGIAVNGEDAGTVDGAERWTRTAVRIDRRHLRRGLNRLTLRWPRPATRGEAALAAAADRLEIGVAADLHPVFGELFSVMALCRPFPPGNLQ